MSRKTKGEIRDQFDTYIWLAWQRIRRRPKYEKDVEELLKVAQEKSITHLKGFPCPESQIFYPSLEIIESLPPEIIIHAYEEDKIKTAYASLVVAYDRVTEEFLDIAEDINYGDCGKKFVDIVMKEMWMRGCFPGQLPELTEFQKEWGILFPVNPKIVIPLGSGTLMEEPLGKIQIDTKRNELKLTVNLNWPNDVVRDRVKQILFYVIQRRERLNQEILNFYGKQNQNRAYYGRLFQVWDLRQQRKNYSQIARELDSDEDTIRKQFYRAYELIYNQKYDHSKFTFRNISLEDLHKTCLDCPTRNTCIELCPEVLPFTEQDQKKYQRELCCTYPFEDGDEYFIDKIAIEAETPESILMDKAT